MFGSFWGRRVAPGESVPCCRPQAATKVERRLICPSSVACQNGAKFCWVALTLSPGVLDVVGVRPFRILAEESRRGRSLGAAGERGLDRPRQTDRGGGQGGGAAGGGARGGAA